MGQIITIEEITDISPEAMFGSEPVVAYDFNKCIEILIERDGMEREEAIDFINFNVIGAYVGLNTPVFIMR